MFTHNCALALEELLELEWILVFLSKTSEDDTYWNYYMSKDEVQVMLVPYPKVKEYQDIQNIMHNEDVWKQASGEKRELDCKLKTMMEMITRSFRVLAPTRVSLSSVKKVIEGIEPQDQGAVKALQLVNCLLDDVEVLTRLQCHDMSFVHWYRNEQLYGVKFRHRALSKEKG